ncbi:hypothetical protein CO683_39350 [Bradyrhizobium ottawaense]|nr:hypothetical protein CO683_39350 [Bradyrhizobium ottawaense]
MPIFRWSSLNGERSASWGHTARLTEFATSDGARTGGAEQKKGFPILQIRIYNVQTNAREEI